LKQQLQKVIYLNRTSIENLLVTVSLNHIRSYFDLTQLFTESVYPSQRMYKDSQQIKLHKCSINLVDTINCITNVHREMDYIQQSYLRKEFLRTQGTRQLVGQVMLKSSYL